MSQPASSEHATTDRISERAHESVDRVAKTAGKGEEKIRHEAANAKERSGETLNSVSAFVSDNPVLSLGIAFAAGTLLSGVLRRKG